MVLQTDELAGARRAATDLTTLATEISMLEVYCDGWARYAESLEAQQARQRQQRQGTSPSSANGSLMNRAADWLLKAVNEHDPDRKGYTKELRMTQGVFQHISGMQAYGIHSSPSQLANLPTPGC